MKRLVWSGWKAEKAAIVQDRRTPAASPRFKPLLSDDAWAGGAMNSLSPGGNLKGGGSRPSIVFTRMRMGS